jgi:hypothetical protein
MMFKPLTESRGEELLMSYLGDFHAKTSLPLEKEQGLKVQEVRCGITWQESSVKYDLNSSLWKTVHCLWSEDLPWSWVTLPKWGLMQSGCVYQHQTLERPISVTECGLWATPQASDCRKVVSTFGSTLRNGKNIPELGKEEGWINPKLAEWLMGWPLDWTDLKPLEMDKSLYVQQQHGNY